MEGNDANGTNNNGVNPNGNGANTGTGEPGGAKLTFQDILNQDKEYQAEFDRRVQQALKKAEENWKTKNDTTKTEAERLAKMTQTEKLQYELDKQKRSYEEIQKKLGARDLRDEAIKIATTEDTKFDPEFLNLFDYENMTAEQLQEKTKLIKSIQDRIVEKTINEWSKEEPPYNPQNTNNNNKADEKIRKAMGLK